MQTMPPPYAGHPTEETTAGRSRVPRGSTTRIAPSAAVVMRPILVLLPVVLFLVPSLLYALTGSPTYTSEARMLVAGFDVQAAAIPGFVEASRSLAATYARLVDSDVIVGPVSNQLDMPRSAVLGHISASSIPDSALIRVIGTASTPEQAAQFATAAADALAKYAQSVGGGGDSDSEVLATYQQAVQDQTQAQLALNAAEKAGLSQRVAQASAAVAAARLQADRAAARYTAGGSSGGVQVIAPALEASSNRRSQLELAIVTAVLLGLVVGTALATLLVNRRAPS